MMKKRLFAALVCAMLLVTLLPTTTFADEPPTYTLCIPTNGNSLYKRSTSTPPEYTPYEDQTDKWSVAGTTPYCTLTLSDGFSFTTNAAVALDLSNVSELVLFGSSEVTSIYYDSGTSFAVSRGAGPLTISGTGTLTATGGTSTSNSYGVSLGDGILTVNGGNIIGIGGSTIDDVGVPQTRNSYGVAASGGITVNSGSITGTGGTSESQNSYGVCEFKGDITVNGGSIEGTGGTGGTGGTSYGVYAEKGDISVSSSGSIEGTGGTSENQNSYGVFANKNITVNNRSTLAGTGGEAKDSSYGVNADNGITVKNRGSITGTGGEANYSGGVRAKTGITVENGGSIEGTGGEAANIESYGVRADGGITVNGSTLTGTGGKAGISSYGVSAFGSITLNSSSTLTGTGGEASTSNGVHSFNTITVNGGSITGTGGESGIYASSGTVTLTNSNVTASGATAIGGKGITVNGGTVTATGTLHGLYSNAAGNSININGGVVNAKATGKDSHGIFVDNGNVTVAGGTVTATGGRSGVTVNSDSDENNGIVTVSKGATLKATGGTATTSDSYGVRAGGSIQVNGGTLEATGGTGSSSHGMSAGSSINVLAGTVLARGYSVALKSNAFESYKVPTVSRDIGGSPTVPFDLKSLSTYKYLRITPITSVNVSPATVSVAKGGTQRFSAAVTGTNEPAQTVTWSVEGNNSASTAINANGVLTVGSDETATTLTVKATSTVDTTKYGTATVTVMPEYVPVENLIRDFLTSVAVNTDLILSGTVDPANATNNTVVWSVSPDDAGKTGAVVSNGTFRANAAGTAKVRATIANGVAKTKDYTKDFTVIVTSEPVPTGGVSGTVFRPGIPAVPIPNADVEIKQGTIRIASTKTDGKGQYHFDGLPYGDYNIIVKTETTSSLIVTALIEIKADTMTKDLTLRSDKINSLLDIKTKEQGAPETPDIVVGGIDEIDTTEPNSGTVTVKLAVQSKKVDTENNDKHKQIKKLAEQESLEQLDIIEITLTRDDTDIGDGNTKVLEFIIPYDFTGKTDVTLFRYHGGTATKLTKLNGRPNAEFADGTYYPAADKSFIYLYAARFSPYAIAYSNAVPPVPPTPAGGDTHTIVDGSADRDSAYTGRFTAGANGAFVLTVQANCEKLTSVTVDGIQLTREKDYTVVCDGTIITFSPAYLATLRDGVHTVRVQFTDGRYDDTFTTPISAAIATAAVAAVPATGSNTASVLWLGAALLALAASIVIRRRRQNG